MSGQTKSGETVVKQPAAQSTFKRFFELLFMLFSAILVLFSWDSARKASEENAVLRSELRRAQQDSGQSADRSGTRCTVCLDNPREVLFQDCGHVCSCSDCASRIRRSDNRCPVCRQNIIEMEERGEVLFSDLSGDNYTKPQEVESLCSNCGKNGITRLLLTKIPHYKEIILMSFSCDECGYQNNEIQSGGIIQEKGIKIEVQLNSERDLSRQVVKSDYASVCIPEIDLEIPSCTQKGEITTVEGILTRTLAGLEQDQPVRKHMDPDAYEKIEKYLDEVRKLLKLERDFNFIINDPSGNSFIENPHVPSLDPGRLEKHYVRTKAQNHLLGLYTQEDIQSDEPVQDTDELTEEKLVEEVLHFATNCPNCNAPAQTNMKVTNIPFFKEVVIMATVCDACGEKTNEVKSGGGIEPKGKKITLRITDKSDLNRDVLKSETCNLGIPELEFEMGGAALGGRFTTLEGLMNNMLDQIEQNSLWGAGDAAAPDIEERMDKFKERLKLCKEGELDFTLILDDPAGNSYLQNLYAPDEDPEMKIEEYERTFDQNEDLGLNDMKTENYQEAS